MKKLDLIEQRFGKLVVKSLAKKNKWKHNSYNCLCDCGAMTIVDVSKLRTGHTTSCGCKKKLRGVFHQCSKRPYESLYNTFVNDTKRRAKQYINELTYEDFLGFVKQNFCHYCKKSLIRAEYGIVENGTSHYLDRKDNKLGYTVNNCVSCCTLCNRIKLDHLTYGQMLSIGQHMQAHPELFGEYAKN